MLKKVTEIVLVLLLFFLSGCNNEKLNTKNNKQELGVEPQKQINIPESQNRMTVQKNNRPLIIKTADNDQQTTSMTDDQLKAYLYDKYQVPKQWGEFLPGIKTAIDTEDKVIALTLDACGGSNGNQYDSELIYYLRQQNIPATLFINSRWIDANYWTFWALNRIPLFEIENHGKEHRPLSMNGRDAWGIKGTEDVNHMTDEVLSNHRRIQRLTGRAPKFFRSGTAYYDEVGVQVTNEIGEQPVNYNVLGDAGATFKKEQVRDALLNAKPGSIVLLHMNHPESETAEGLKLAIPELQRRGFKFVKLEDYPLK